MKNLANALLMWAWLAGLVSVAAGCATGFGADPPCGDGTCGPGEELSCPMDCTGCGDGRAAEPEACDGDDTRGQTCSTLGLGSGQLACGDDCRLDTSGCSASECGNAVANPGEDCDGSDLGGATCSTLGLAAGVLACRTDCTFDISGCCNDFCERDGQSECRGSELRRCAESAAGCLDWVVQDCADAGAICIDDGSGAQCSCSDACREASQRCDGDQIATCERLATGCLGWVVTRDCTADGEMCVSGPGGTVGCQLVDRAENCATRQPLVEGSNTFAWDASRLDYVTTAPSCASAAALRGPDIVMSHEATEDGYVEFSMTKTRNMLHFVVVSDAACGIVAESSCAIEFGGDTLEGVFRTRKGVTYHLYAVGRERLPNPLTVELETTSCAGLRPKVVNQTPADGALTTTRSPTFVLELDRAINPTTGSFTIIGNMGTNRGFALGATSEIALSNNNRRVAITPRGGLPAGEQVSISWTGVVDDLCGTPIEDAPWQVTIASPTCAPGVGGMVGTSVSRGAVQSLPIRPTGVAADSDPDGFLYLVRARRLYRVAKRGGRAQDIAALHGFTSRELGRAVVVAGDEVFTVTSPRGQSQALWRLSTDGGESWAAQDYALFPRTPSGTVRGVATHGGRVYLVSTPFSSGAPTEVWSVPLEAGAPPVSAVLEASVANTGGCYGLAVDDASLYLACAKGDQIVRVDRATGAARVVTTEINVSGTGASLHAHDLDDDGLADVLYHQGAGRTVSYVCDPGGAPFVAELVRYGDADPFTEGLGFTPETGTLWSFDLDAGQVVSIR